MDVDLDGLGLNREKVGRRIQGEEKEGEEKGVHTWRVE